MTTANEPSKRGQWMALAAAILGWLFDGFEMGLFPLVMKPALTDLLGNGAPVADNVIAKWEGIMHAAFLIGAATGGVLFGWLGDRLGRVRAMSLSVLTFAIFSGLCGVGTSAGMVLFFRFIASLGMGGEWSLGVSLVMELWPGRSRAWLAGLIGAASNVGFILVALVSMGLTVVVSSLAGMMATVGMGPELIELLTRHSGWRLLMLAGALPALLTFFIRIFVPESKKWQDSQAQVTANHWAAKDLWGVAIGCLGPLLMVLANAMDMPLGVQLAALALGLFAAVVGYSHPVKKFLSRSTDGQAISVPPKEIVRRMYVGAILSGIVLLATWGAIQRAPSWAGHVREADLALEHPEVAPENLAKVYSRELAFARSQTQIATGIGAVIGTILAAVVGDKLNRRTAYSLLCIGSIASMLWFFLGNSTFNTMYLVSALVAGGVSASFYGWLPLYLPELFPTKVRAVGQGFAFNFGRIMSGAGSLYIGDLINIYFDGKYPVACSMLTMIYLFGLVAIWFAPETKGQPLPD